MTLEFPDGRALDAILLGRVTIDINTKDVAYSFAETPSLSRYVGGSPANTAIGLTRLGSRVGFIGKVSPDSLGDYVVSVMRDEGVDVSHLTAGAPGTCLGLAFTEAMVDGHTNLVLYREGRVADLQLEPADISADYVASARCLVVSGTALAASPSREAALLAVEAAKRSGTTIVFDIDYRPQTWRNPAEAGIYARIVADQADLIMGAREEFDLMAPAGIEDEDDAAVAQRAFDQGTGLVIIKHGKQGSMAYSSDGEVYQVGILPIRRLKSTGGGDAYSSALLHGLLSGAGLQQALEMATTSATMVIGAPSCSEAMPRPEELEAFVSSLDVRMNEVVHPVSPGTAGTAGRATANRR